MIGRLLVVRGRVQGVWYRASCQEEAHRLGLNGTVRNRPDGAVEVRVEGDKGAVDQLIAWCRQGPPLARVADVVVDEVEPTGAEGFRVIG